MSQIPINEQHQLDALIKRVPFTSLPLILMLLTGFGLLSVCGLILLVALPLQGMLKEALIYGIIISGFFAFAFWSLLTRRKEYKSKFKEMLTRTPILTWNYKEEDWDKWLKYTERIAFGNIRGTTPLMMTVMLILWGIAGGTMLSLSRTDTSFREGFLFCIGVMSLPVVLYYLYWKRLRFDWEREPSEARIFEDGIFFHHKFVDWKETPEKGVFLWVEREEQPIATLNVKIQGAGAKLAPHLKELILPIPHEQVTDMIRLARSLSQNVNYPVEELNYDED